MPAFESELIAQQIEQRSPSLGGKEDETPVMPKLDTLQRKGHGGESATGDLTSAIVNNSPQAKQAAQLQAIAANHPTQQQQPSQKKASPEPAQRENNTGLPDNLKSGIENLSGYSMDDVKVHYNSDQPTKLQAYAYAQGTDIHLASGQEKHLPHEAWHVVQQKQGHVKPTIQMKGEVNVNDDKGLEKEADVMGAKAFGLGQQVMQESVGNSVLTPGPKQQRSGIRQLTKVSHSVVQLAEWKTGTDEEEATHYWDDLMDGVMWFSNGKEIWYKIKRPGKNDYSTLENERKTWKQWHELRRGTHPEEYPGSVPDVEAGEKEEENGGGPSERPNFAGDLLTHLHERYVTTVDWDAGSGAEVGKKKVIVINSAVKKDEGGTEDVYQNRYYIMEDRFSADWNQRTKDREVGTKTSTAMFNSDLLTCHRELARDFASKNGVPVPDDSEGFKISRTNINNEDWQAIYDMLPVLIRAKLTTTSISEAQPLPFQKEISHKGKSATSMWGVFKDMIPNTKAVFLMIQQRFPGYEIKDWTFKGGTATATIHKRGSLSLLAVASRLAKLSPDSPNHKVRWHMGARHRRSRNMMSVLINVIATVR
ncbi:MAG: DUF4157 domain-containing protein [Calothrix sp. MO_192.B10]|nr:DUF4157 domain-containing protein [Calothrix sp. MO_192.B10]